MRLGLESDYFPASGRFPGVEPWLEELHGRVPLSHVLGSIHYQVADYRKRFYTGDTHSYQELYFDHLARSAESGLFDTLSHPDLIKNEDPAAWDFERLRPHIERALDRIAATGVAMELNTSGLQKALREMNPSPAQLVLMRERAIPRSVFSSTASARACRSRPRSTACAPTVCHFQLSESLRDSRPPVAGRRSLRPRGRRSAGRAGADSRRHPAARAGRSPAWGPRVRPP